MHAANSVSDLVYYLQIYKSCLRLMRLTFTTWCDLKRESRVVSVWFEVGWPRVRIEEVGRAIERSGK